MLSRSLLTLAVVEDSGSPSDALRAAREYARAVALPVQFAGDAGRTLGRLLGVTGYGTPFAVVTDPDGIIRLRAVSHLPRPAGSSVLAEALQAFFLGTESSALPLAVTQWRRFDPHPDVPVKLADGGARSLADLSADRPLILTFLTGGDPAAEKRRVASALPLARCRSTRIAFAHRTAAGMGDALRNAPPGVAVLPAAEPLFRAFGVDQGPITVILYGGHCVVREAMPCQGYSPVLQAMACTVFLNSSARFHAKPGSAQAMRGLR